MIQKEVANRISANVSSKAYGRISILAQLQSSIKTLFDVTPEKFDEKVDWIRTAAGDRIDDIELSVLVFSTQVTDDKESAVNGTAEMFGFTTDQIEQTPMLLIGSSEEIADSLRERRERWGISYIIVQDTAIDTLTPVVAELTGT